MRGRGRPVRINPGVLGLAGSVTSPPPPPPTPQPAIVADGGTAVPSYGQVLGLTFQVARPLTITSLGLWIPVESEASRVGVVVALNDFALSTVLASVALSASTPGSFVYESITHLTLTSITDVYLIYAHVPTDLTAQWSSGAMAFAGDLVSPATGYAGTDVGTAQALTAYAGILSVNFLYL